MATKKKNVDLIDETAVAASAAETAAAPAEEIRDQTGEVTGNTEKTRADSDTEAGQTVAETAIAAVDEKAALCTRVAGEVFARHSGKSVLYFTSDNLPFFDREDAKQHAMALRDKSIIVINRTDE